MRTNILERGMWPPSKPRETDSSTKYSRPWIERRHSRQTVETVLPTDLEGLRTCSEKLLYEMLDAEKVDFP